MTDEAMDGEIRAARILIVDDLAANAELLADALDTDGYSNVRIATKAAEGLALCQADPFDLVLLDIRMPEIDGHEFVRRLRAECPARLPAILVLTAQTDDDTRRRALSMGVRDFLNKPVVIWEFLHRVHNLLEVEVLYRRARQTNDELEARVAERTAELEATRREVIRRLATVGEFRDNDTGMHVVRMSHFAYRLALAAGMPPAEAALLRDAAPLHDIGKVGIPDAILLKPGRLDPDEWEVMKRHAAFGGEILSNSGFPLLDLARTIAVTHHEHWDGSGYPLGLQGATIPLAGRIVAIADVFDALTSTRPYKAAWPVDAAIGFLREQAGRHLDPALVELFVADLPEMLALRERFQDVPGALPHLLTQQPA